MRLFIFLLKHTGFGSGLQHSYMPRLPFLSTHLYPLALYSFLPRRLTVQHALTLSVLQAGGGSGPVPAGADVGLAVGAAVGLVVGLAVGCLVGLTVGVAVGFDVGAAVGTRVGTGVGALLGAAVGAAVGTRLGTGVGALVGAAVGEAVGTRVGTGVGALVGAAVGLGVGTVSGLQHLIFQTSVAQDQPAYAGLVETSVQQHLPSSSQGSGCTRRSWRPCKSANAPAIPPANSLLCSPSVV